MSHNLALQVLAFSCLAVLTLGPATAQGQGGPSYSYKRVETCSEQCMPADANPGPLPLNGTETVNVILYPHRESPLARAPMNVQPPDPEEGYRNDVRMVTVNTETGTPADVHQRNGDLVWYSSAGVVFVVDGKWLVQQEPGFAEDVHIAADTIWLYLYLTATNLPGEDDGSGPLGPLT